jgi:hypothetical protein
MKKSETLNLVTEKGLYPVPQNVLDLIKNPAKVIKSKDIERIFSVNVSTAQKRFSSARKALGKTRNSDCLTIYQYYQHYNI